MSPRPRKPYAYQAHLKFARWPTDPATGGPLPLELTIAIASIPAAYAVLRDLESSRLPTTIQIVGVQARLPKPRHAS